MSDKVGPAITPTGAATVQQREVPSEKQGVGPEVFQLVLHDIIERSEFGARKYGHALRVTADVDFETNAYQELLDLLIYVRASIEDREVIRAMLYQAYRLIEVALLNPEEIESASWEQAAREYISSYKKLSKELAILAPCGAKYPCAHAPDGGNHPEVPAQGA